MIGGMKYFIFFFIDVIFIFNLSYICILEGIEFIFLINKCILNLNKYIFIYMYIICIFDLKNCYCYYKIFEVYRTVLNVFKFFIFIFLIVCNFKSIYKRLYKLFFLVLMIAFL